MSEQTFGIEELLAQLKQDDSWESDPKLREQIVDALYGSLTRGV
ncbi:MAG TPA: hypothetical protein VFC74_05525 [Oscillospiraceae bacterium]|nr:hypothetical protein [Oscillospiraceae bacterium]